MYIYNLAQKFKKVVSHYGGSNAIVTESGVLTYDELDAVSDQFCSFLLSSGLGIGDVICISGDKTSGTIACIIGALKAGVIYSVFDPASPMERLSKIFQQCLPKLVISSGELSTQIQDLGFPSIESNALADKLSKISPEKPLIDVCINKITGVNSAYIMFTSGSTGVPKGAVMTHQNVLNLIAWSLETYSFTSEDVLTNVNPLYFDNSVFDLYAALFNGASLVLFDAKTVKNPELLMRLLREHKCTSWFSVPSMLIFLQTMKAFRPENMPFMKRIIFGGEGYPKAKLKNLFDLYSSRLTFYNVYGPTECTCICSSYQVSEDDFADLIGFLPLGVLSPNFYGVIVDEELRTIENQEVGELLLGGPNVGRGYFNDPERTQASFIQNPLHNQSREYVYRTGDLVYLNHDDSKIYIVGRQDNQVKHMGYRIELEEN